MRRKPEVSVCPLCGRFMADPERHKRYCLALLPKEPVVGRPSLRVTKLSLKRELRERFVED